MPWGRIDDSLYDHPKLDKLGRYRLQCVGLNTLAQSWCNRWLTDGALPAERVARLGGTPAMAELLVAAHLWERTDEGFLIHDFLDYNDSRETILAQRDAARQRMKRNRSRGRAPDVQANAARTSDEVRAPRTRDSRPVPSRPIPVPSLPPDPHAETANGIDNELWAKVQRLAEELTGRAHPLGGPYGGHGAQALAQATAVPWEQFEAGWRQVAAVYGRPTVRQLVFDAEDVLLPTGKAKPAPVSKADRETAEAKAALRAAAGPPR